MSQPVSNTYSITILQGIKEDGSPGWIASPRWIHVVENFTGSIVWTIQQPASPAAAVPFNTTNGIDFFDMTTPPAVTYSNSNQTATVSWTNNNTGSNQQNKYLANILVDNQVVPVDPAVINDGPG